MNNISTSDIEQFDVEAVNRYDKQQPLYAPRKKIYPKLADGVFRRFKWMVMLITLSIYYVTPWLRWDRGEFAPNQAVLVDLYHRRFYFFWIEIWPQEFYYIASLLIMAAIGLFMVTSSIGRAWCGYTCPQTVWVDLFLVIERFIEGDRNKRMRLDKSPINPTKLAKKISKHIIWLLIAAATGGAWIFYFADAPTLLLKVLNGSASTVAYGTIAVLTFTTYSLGGLMREQVCTYMCPWPRIQAAMLDENSLTVTYNAWRGEPRSHHSKIQNLIAGSENISVSSGDCIDCKACVAVCPMGIDIRDGQQLECITCALCIDACDKVMEKLGKPKGLISYSTLADYKHNTELFFATVNSELVQVNREIIKPKFKHTTISRILQQPRTIIYFAIWALIGLSMMIMLTTRSHLKINVLHDRNPLYVRLSDGSIRNGYIVKILNMIPKRRTFTLTVEDFIDGEMIMPQKKNDRFRKILLNVKPDSLLAQRLFVISSPNKKKAVQRTFRFQIHDNASSESAEYTTIFSYG
ncbi:cytochrome c oxidase accessory protein CcoG [Candidatus Endolissoclinum faulkneri L5]|uniref:Cytochrome c oxidase accessory protein CcoG n=1 Tax=Candidatus Endolissoclinum faulkneri L5 TaxID=1401328 RepID=V9TTT5_9PROT|nr:cytochrome c oxidase accessory protein CcoG [Candidatus Endolissoclinum faulkneri]AHC73577.1 cytochrome c oxidase accessory protein CcoG [Candidatus Endolissoclinum faulkneri L5]